MLSDYELEPTTTRFLAVIPMIKNADWYGLTKYFEILHIYPSGSEAVFKIDGEMETTSTPYMVIYKDMNTVIQENAWLLLHFLLGHASQSAIEELVFDEKSSHKHQHILYVM